MSVNIIKLCVGVSDISHLAAIQAKRLAEQGRNCHITRMVPRRAAEVLDGGSIYWVMAGMIVVRQLMVAIEPFIDHDQVRRCRFELDPVLVPVVPRPRRPFQGWRYFASDDAPDDLNGASDAARLSETMRRDLADLGLL